MSITEGIRYASIISILLPLILLLMSETSFRVVTSGLLLSILLISLFSDIALAIEVAKDIETATTVNTYFAGLFVLLILFYRSLISDKRGWLTAFVVIYILTLSINSLFFQPLTDFQGYTRAVEGVLLITCTIWLFASMIEKLPVPDIRWYGLFWINTAILYYFSFDLLLFVFSDFVFENLTPQEGRVFWVFHNVNNIVKNFLFALGIYYSGRESSE